MRTAPHPGRAGDGLEEGNGFAGAACFLTVFGRGVAPDASALAWFPVVGWLIGGALGATWWALGRALPPLACAGVVLAEDALLTGLLHLDGLCDSADGLLPHMSGERRLQVMAEPQVGAFGVIVTGLVLLCRFGALAHRAPRPWWVAVLALGALWAASRSAMVLAMASGRYARRSGLASSFVGEPGPEREPSRLGGRVPAKALLATGALGVAAPLAALAAWSAVGAAPVLAAEAAGAAVVVLLARKRIGGWTGDVLGAAGVVAETLGLLVLAGRW